MWHKLFEQIFVSPSQWGFAWNLALISLVVIEEKKFENIESEWKILNLSDLDQGPWITLTIKIHVLIWLTSSINFDIIDYNSFWKKIIPLTFSHTKAQGTKSDLAIK